MPESHIFLQFWHLFLYVCFIYPAPQVGIATGNIYSLGTNEVSQHSFRIRSTVSTVAASAPEWISTSVPTVRTVTANLSRRTDCVGVTSANRISCYEGSLYLDSLYCAKGCERHLPGALRGMLHQTIGIKETYSRMYLTCINSASYRLLRKIT